MDTQKNINLAPHTYFKIGGPADEFVEVKTKDELVEAISYAKTKNIPFFILGGGSNIVVSDKGFRGLVIKNKTSSIEEVGIGGTVDKKGAMVGSVIVKADSGVPANRLIAYTIDRSLEGLEVFLGLPGSVGGAIYNNSHHMNDLIGNHVVSVEILNSKGEIESLLHDDLEFGYDYSRFHKSGETILSASFRLTPGDKNELVGKGKEAVARRAKTQPLGAPSSGCIFKNISLADAMRIGTPNHTLSVGYLIEHAGLKGTRVGGAVVSDIHANFIVNDQGATAKNIFDLIEVVKQKIKEVYGVALTPEVFLVGEK